MEFNDEERRDIFEDLEQLAQEVADDFSLAKKKVSFNNQDKMNLDME
jgi:hypothetical protein